VIIKLEGFSELEATLNELSNEITSRGENMEFRRILTKSAEAAMKPVEDSARSLAPYDGNRSPNKADQPHLKNTVRLDFRVPTEKDKRSHYVNESDAAIAVVSVKKSAVSLSQEFGNAKTAAQPYLRTSLERNSNQVIEILKSEMSTRMEAFVQRIAKRKK
jgi:HK97 gp10 family phage protein